MHNNALCYVDNVLNNVEIGLGHFANQSFFSGQSSKMATQPTNESQSLLETDPFGSEEGTPDLTSKEKARARKAERKNY